MTSPSAPKIKQDSDDDQDLPKHFVETHEDVVDGWIESDDVNATEEGGAVVIDKQHLVDQITIMSLSTLLEK